MRRNNNFNKFYNYNVVSSNGGVSVIPYQRSKVNDDAFDNSKEYSNKFIDETVYEEGGDPISLNPQKLNDLRKKSLESKKKVENIYTQTYTSYVNIDSSQRNKLSENIYDKTLYNLPPFPLVFTNGSSIVEVNLNNHTFQKNDRIILNSIISKNVMLNNVLSVKKDSLFMRVNQEHHGLSLFGLYDDSNPAEFESVEYVDNLPSSYNENDIIPDTGIQYYILKKNVNIDLTIQISGIKGDMIGNIPVNYLNRKQTVYLLFTKGSATKFVPEKNSYLIKLLRKSTINYKDGVYNNNNQILVKYFNLFGVPLNYINSGTPTNEDQLATYLVVTNVKKHSFSVDVRYNAIIDTSDPSYMFYYYTDFTNGICDDIDIKKVVNGHIGGGSSCYARKIIESITGFPNPNNYLIKLDKTYKNVIQVTILSSIFPSSQRIINTTNNKLYWRNLGEGNYIYYISITPGNYNIERLQTEIEKEFNNTPRYPYTIEFPNDPNPELVGKTTIDGQDYDSNGNYKFNIIDVNIDNDTDIVSFSSFKKIQQQDTLTLKILRVPDCVVQFTAAENFQINFGTTGTNIVPQNISPFDPNNELLFIYFTDNIHIRIPNNFFYANEFLYQYIGFVSPYTSTTNGTNTFMAQLITNRAILTNFYRTQSVYNNIISNQELNSINTSTLLQNFIFDYINQKVTMQNHNLKKGDLIITDQFIYPSIPNQIYVFEIISIIDSENFYVSKINHGEKFKFIYDGILINFSIDNDIYYWQDQILSTNPITPININGNNNTLSFTSIVPTNENKTLLYVYQPNNMLNIGDIITISGSTSINNISEDIINCDHTIVNIIDVNNYVVTIKKSVPVITFNPPIINTVYITYPDLFQMFFNFKDTLGKILNFRNPGQPGSITDYKHTIKNNDSYINDVYCPSANIPIKKINMTGTNYFYIVSPEIGLYQNTLPVQDVFAKLRWYNSLLIDPLSNSTIIYDSFVPTSSIFDNPISVLYELNISIQHPDGTLVDFNGIDHSFTIAIVEVYNQPDETDINVRINSETLVRKTG